MKKLIALTALLLASSTFAISETDSWSEIKEEVSSNHKLFITGDYAYVGQIVSIFNVCTDGENFTTTKKLAVYDRVRVPRHMDNNDTERDGWASVVVGYQNRTYPLNAIQTQRQCDNQDKNCRYVEVEFNQKEEKMITVKKLVGYQGSNDRPVYKTLFSKLFVVPACN